MEILRTRDMVRCNPVRLEKVKGRHGREEDDFQARILFLHPRRDRKHACEMTESHTIRREHHDAISRRQFRIRNYTAIRLGPGLSAEHLQTDSEHLPGQCQRQKRRQPRPPHGICHVRTQAQRRRGPHSVQLPLQPFDFGIPACHSIASKPESKRRAFNLPRLQHPARRSQVRSLRTL